MTYLIFKRYISRTIYQILKISMSLLMFYHFAKVIKYWPAAVGKVKMSGHSNGIRYQYDDYVVGSL